MAEEEGAIPEKSNCEKESEGKIRVTVEGGFIKISCPCCGDEIILDPVVLSRISESHRRGDGGTCTCFACGYEWCSNVDNPKRCPRCGSYKWNVEPKRFTCNRCNHSWVSRNRFRPNRCPACRSVYWDVKGPVPGESGPVPEERSQSDFGRDMESAVRMCLEGCGVMDVCEDADLPVLELIRTLTVRNHDYRL